MRIAEALGIGRREVISLVGGGGKTTLMFALARELAAGGQAVVTTTTTRILDSEPALHGSPLLLVESDEAKLLQSVADGLPAAGHVTIAAARLTGQGKLKGISPAIVDALSQLHGVDCVIVEADGAAHRSLKAPNATEPVIPDSTTLVIAVVGIDALGAPLCDETVFRADIASRLTGLNSGEAVTADAVATLITHSEGIARGSPKSARIVPFINKIDIEGGLAKGRQIAGEIMRKNHPRISMVVLGQARAADPVAEIISRQPMELGVDNLGRVVR